MSKLFLAGADVNRLGLLAVVLASAFLAGCLQSTHEERTGAQVGELAPNFTAKTFDGKNVSLSDFRGKKVLVNFCASWCPPCRQEMPVFQRIYSNSSDFVVIGINLQEDETTVRRFSAELNLSFPLVLDPDESIKRGYQVFTQPTSILVDGNGRVVYRKNGSITEKELLAQLVEGTVEEARAAEEVVVENGVRHLKKYDLKDIVSGGPPKDGIPSIDSPKFVGAGEADWLQDNELVLALDYNGVVRAYPFQIMVWHEIVNDVVAGEPLAVTYCPLCGTALVFKRTLNSNEAGTVLEFGVSGKLYNSDLLMYDRKTDSLWQQATGEAVVGALSGAKLEQVPAEVAVWGEWKKTHRAAQVLSRDTGFTRKYGTDPYDGYYTSERILFPVKNSDSRLHPKAVVYGLAVNGSAEAFPADLLGNGSIVSEVVGGEPILVSSDPSDGVVRAFSRRLGGRVLEFELQGGSLVDGDGRQWSFLGRSESAQARLEQLPLARSFWFAWYAFHPTTKVFENPP